MAKGVHKGKTTCRATIYIYGMSDMYIYIYSTYISNSNNVIRIRRRVRPVFFTKILAEMHPVWHTEMGFFKQTMGI